MEARILREEGTFFLEINGEKKPLYGYMTYLPRRGRYRDFGEAGVPLAFVPVYLGDRGINQETVTRPFQRGCWIGEGSFDFSPAAEAFRLASAGGAYLIPRIMTEPPAWWDRAHPEELCRSFTGEPAHASFSSEKRHRDVTGVLEAFWQWCRGTGWSERIVGWHLAGGNTEEFLRPLPHPGFLADYSAPAAAAWRRFSGTEADPPPPLERMYRGETEAVIRYREFLSVSMADAVIALCREGKRITEGKIPMGAFYGYLVNVTDPERGHAALSRVLASEDVDFLASPFCYTNGRALGTDWPVPGPAASARLHGKPWLIEADIRTCLTEPLKNAAPDAAPKVNRLYEGGVWAGPETEEGSLSAVKKAFGTILCGGLGAWWFDMWGGWYDSPALMAFQREAAALFREARYSSAADTAVLLDEGLICRQTGGPAFHAHHDLLLSLSKTGAVFDVYDRADLSRIDFSRYRAAVFPGETGELPAVPVPLRVGTAGAGKDGDFVSGGRLSAERGEMRFADPAPSPEQLRAVLAASGAHIWSYTGDVFRAGCGFAVLHACSSGIKRIHLPGEGTIRDAFGGEEMNVSEAFAEFSMEYGETRIFRIG